MERMTAMDAQFLYVEDVVPAAHAHTVKMSIYDPPPDGYSFEDSKDALRARIHRLPPFRRRLVPVPFGLHHPVWIEDPEFDLDWHVRRMGCPAPGGPRELCELVSDILSRALDRSRPLWELYMVEGLEGGKVAAVAKVHHAIADGISSAELLDLYHDAEPTTEVEPEDPPWRPEPVPPRISLVVGAIVDVIRTLLTGLPRLLKAARERRTVAGLTESEMPPKPFKAPTLRFNRMITPHRIYTFHTASLEDVKAVRAAFGCTINDVFLASVAGGMRRYLEAKGELPDVPLVGSIPVSTRGPADHHTWGNRLSKIYTLLRTDTEDPVARLEAQRAEAQKSKQDLEITRGARLENWIEVMPLPMLRATVRLFDRLKRVGGPSSENLILSNVPGPRRPMYAGSSKIDAFFSVGPPTVGVALNITVWSYVDQLNYSFIACREAMPTCGTSPMRRVRPSPSRQSRRRHPMTKSIAEIRAELTAPGQLLEITEEVVRGVPTRVWKNAPPTLRQVLELSRLQGAKDFMAVGNVWEIARGVDDALEELKKVAP